MARPTWHLPRKPKSIIAVTSAALVLVVGVADALAGQSLAA